MRRLLILLLAGLMLGAFWVALLERDAGYVMIRYGQTTVETTVWFALLLGVVAWLVFAMVMRLLIGVLGAQSRLAGWLGARKKNNAINLTNRGLISFIEGYWSQSRRQLLRAARYSEAPLLNYLIAARASFLLGDAEGTRRYLGDAEAVDSEARLAGEITQAELQLSAQQYEQAVATLTRARRQSKRHPYALALLAQAYKHLADWPALDEILPRCRDAGVLNPAQQQQLELACALGLLQTVQAGSREALLKLWRKTPESIRLESAEFVEGFVDALMNAGADNEAQSHIIDSLSRHWRPSLVRRLGLLRIEKPEKLARRLGQWRDEHPRDTQLMLAQARVAMACKRWNEAGQHFEAALRIKPTAECLIELARLREAEGQVDEAATLRQRAGLIGAGELPTLPLPERGGQ
jgi:HemY protein